jgi:hypothetical protein
VITLDQAAAVAENGAGAIPRPRFRAALELMSDPPPVVVIAGIAWRQSVTVLVSESGAGKTFVLLDQAAAVSDGRAWHGRAVQQGAVAYISYEGDALGLRLRALQEAGAALAHLHVLRAREPLSPRVERDGNELPSLGERLLAEDLRVLATTLANAGAPPLGLIIIDTVRASLVGSEDRSEDVSAYLRAVRRLLAAHPEATGILAHHAGWQDGETRRKRERGSSALRGNADVTLYLEVTGEDAEQGLAYLTLTALKVRDDLRPPPLRLIRSRVTLQVVDDDGRPQRSCRIEADHRQREDLDAEVERAEAAAAAALEEAALDAIAKHEVTSVAMLRELLGVRQPVVAAVVARLLTSDRIRRASQRQPYRVVPSSTDGEPGMTDESYRTAPPYRGGGTTGQGRARPARQRASRTGRNSRSGQRR